MDWEYEELFDAIHEAYQEFRSENMSETQALSRTLSEFESVMNLGGFEKAVIIIAYGEIVLSIHEVFHKSKDYLIRELKELDLKHLEAILSIEQINNLNMRKKSILDTIGEKPVTFILD